MKKAMYKAPELTVVEFKTEQGYASSNRVANVASTINSQIRENMDQWVVDQEVTGQNVNTTNDGHMAAGYFYSGNTDGWFN